MDKSTLAKRLLVTPKDFDQEHKLDGLSTTSKLLLIRLIMKQGGRAVTVKQDELAHQAGLSARAISLGLGELLGFGLLVLVGKESSGRGRPLPCVQVDGQLLRSLQSIPEPPGEKLFEGIVESLLAPSPNQAETKKGLTPLNRMVLGVLYSMADERGVVRELSVGDLRRLAGLSGDQFVSQISKLSWAGFIRQHISGVSGRYLFGKAKGLFFMNLGHPEFGPMGATQVVVLGEQKAIDKDPCDSIQLYLDSRLLIEQDGGGYLLLKGQRAPPLALPGLQPNNRAELLHSRWGNDIYGNVWPKPKAEHPEFPLHQHFADRQVGIQRLLQALICEKAATVVESGLPARAYFRLHADLEAAYWGDVLSPSCTHLASPPLLSAIAMMVEWVTERASALLASVRRDMALPALEAASYLILPVPIKQTTGAEKLLRRFRVSVVVYPHRVMPADHSKCAIVELFPVRSPGSFSAGAIKFLKNEVDLPSVQREKFGLVMKPKVYPQQSGV